MSLTCVVKGCSNSSRKLKKWLAETCEKHLVCRKDANCTCEPPFRLHPFSTEKKKPEDCKLWIKLTNRSVERSSRNALPGFWEPSKDSRVCSLHFKDGKPSQLIPHPTVNMGYEDPEERAQMFSPPGLKRSIHSKNIVYSTPRRKRKKLI